MTTKRYTKATVTKTGHGPGRWLTTFTRADGSQEFLRHETKTSAQDWAAWGLEWPAITIPVPGIRASK